MGGSAQRQRPLCLARARRGSVDGADPSIEGAPVRGSMPIASTRGLALHARGWVAGARLCQHAPSYKAVRRGSARAASHWLDMKGWSVPAPRLSKPVLKAARATPARCFALHAHGGMAGASPSIKRARVRGIARDAPARGLAIGTHGGMASAGRSLCTPLYARMSCATCKWRQWPIA